MLVCMCVCVLGEAAEAMQNGREGGLHSQLPLPSPTNLPPISVPSRKKSGISSRVMSLHVWLCGKEIECF